MTSDIGATWTWGVVGDSGDDVGLIRIGDRVLRVVSGVGRW